MTVWVALRGGTMRVRFTAAAWLAIAALAGAATVGSPSPAGAHDGWHITKVSALPCALLCPGWEGAEAMGGYDPCATPYTGPPGFYDEVTITPTIGEYWMRYYVDAWWDVWACDRFGRIINTPWAEDCQIPFVGQSPVRCSSHREIRVRPWAPVRLRVFNVLGGLPEANLWYYLSYGAGP